MVTPEENHPSAPSHVIGETTEMPKPLRRLPELPEPGKIRAVRAAARKHLGMGDRAAGAMSTIWVRPDDVLPQIEQPRRMRIPGGDLLYVEGLVWIPRLMADPFNPRNAADHRYPVSGGGASSLEHDIAGSITAGRAELAMTAPSRDALLNALSKGMAKTRVANTPYPPIGDQGIMDAPFGVMTVFGFEDGTPDVAVPGVREGSSRVTHAQAMHELEPEDTVLRMPSGSKAMTDFIAEINSIVDKPAAELTENDKARVRCATTNFILIVGFDPDVDGSIDLAEAVKTKVAQEHLNIKADWSLPARHSVMADDCLRSAFGESLLTSGQEYDWLRGLMTADTASAAGVSKDADDRTTRLLYLFTTDEPKVHAAIRRPIAFVLSRDNTRKVQVKKTTKVPYAVELVSREFRGRPGYENSTVDRMVKVVENGAKITGLSPWTMTSRSLNALEKAALAELHSAGKPGASCTELAVRALYYIAVHDVLRVPRNDQGATSDRRTVAEVLEAMLDTPRGIAQLALIVRDGRRGQRPFLRDEAGEPVMDATGTDPVTLQNHTMRYDLYPKGQASEAPQGQDPFLAAQIRLKDAVNALEITANDLEAVKDDEGNKLVEQQGLPTQAKAWRKQLRDVAERLSDWYEVGVEYRASNADIPASPTTDPGDEDPEAA
ncbi:hypothetical protein [Cryptosporangium phraense]|uniref:Uncharacterized protein n=1 Tax=Cryptosporangium phraense TaxID=2593070 RepID=A0A545AQX7_9ACTN|nr:hypothetical protein [Cryptosporangium phraense]TQS43726.1 hypothetical protein FL583_16945 [Cryptosporangium phraense]